jgi:UDP-N-acetyl-D-mannosaminuronic acid transferase (WecB/TagA/CpsF family)
MAEIRDTPADVYLVGAGSPGKAYAVEAATVHGAVALEIGSLFDGWAGMTHTRSHLRQRSREEWAL